MEIVQLFTVIIALAILAEVTYLVVKLPRQVTGSRKQMRPIFVDTSVLIDGRIIAVAQSGFIGDTLMIPRSVIGELQFLADNADHDKRARARHGLDVVKDLQAMTNVSVEIYQDGSKAEEGVDERLLNLAKKYNGAVCTIDYNLNKVAVVENIEVLNVNELAQSLRMAYLPGERMLLELTQKGQDNHQGIGHLTDGTMVVVEHASKHIGESVEIEFIRSLQTAAGKMMFARLTKKNEEPAKPSVRPQGKKPIKKAVAKIEKTPSKKEPKSALAPVLEPVKTATVYHSDPRDHKKSQQQRKASSTPKPSQSDARKPKEKASVSQQSTAARPVRKKPKTSSQREAALIDLVENQ